MGVLKTVATFGLVGRSDNTPVGVVSLNIVRGSVLDFHPTSSNTITTNTTTNSHSTVGAIVNAANAGLLRGGCVDGAINKAGGRELWHDREALPFISGSKSIRCRTGGAVITGPAPNNASYGTLHVPYVIHAVGPNYLQFTTDEDDDWDEHEINYLHHIPDQLLRSAHQESLARCREQGITDVAFSLISAGANRGTRTVEEVLTIGVVAIRDWYQNSTIDTEMEAVPGKETTEMETEQKKKGLADTTTTATSVNVGVGGDINPVLPSESESESKKQAESQQQQQPPNPRTLKTITLCGFNEKEVNLLVKVCHKIFRTNDNSSLNAKRPRSP